MKRNLLLLITSFSVSSLSFAQVGINKTNPHLSADLELGSTNKSLLLNRVPNTAAIANAVNGMLIYDVSEQCVKAFQGGAWSQCFWKESTFALVCASAVFTPSSATQNQPYTGTLTIPYTGGDGSAYAAQNIQSNGLTAILTAGNFAIGNGSLQFTIIGTPVTAGNAIFSVTVNGSTCSSLSLPINNGTPVIPPNITINEGIYFVGSVFDNDYSPYTTPTGPATTARPVAADGILDKLADYQGFIPTTGLSIFIPATATGGGNLTAWSSITTVPANLTEDGISRQLKLSWDVQSYNANTRSIKATLTAIGGTLNARKLDINAGIGNDNLGVLMARFPFPSTSTGTSKNYDVRILPGIPDKMFGLPDATGVTNNHNFLYLPVQAEDGLTWLNNNLGADYSNTESSSFSIAQQATTANDFKAYGSLFQWGRKPDGHDLIKWTASNTGAGVYGTIDGGLGIDNPTNPLFIKSGGDWRTTAGSSTTLWLNSASANTPCPIGFKVPSQAQIENYLNASNLGAGINGAAASKLAFPAPGTRGASDGVITSISAGSSGFYWTNTAGSLSSPSAMTLQIPTFGAPSATSGVNKAQGNSVRCIKE